MTTTDQILRKSIETPSGKQPPLRITMWGTLVYLVMLAAVLALAGTGVGWSYLIQGKPMHGWVLMAHASFAPAFAVALTLVALTWSDRCRFGCNRSRMRGWAKTLFWLILVLGLVVILSGVVPMTPIFGTDGQHFLYLTHRYAAIALTGAVVLHLLCLIRIR